MKMLNIDSSVVRIYAFILKTFIISYDSPLLTTIGGLSVNQFLIYLTPYGNYIVMEMHAKY